MIEEIKNAKEIIGEALLYLARTGHNNTQLQTALMIAVCALEKQIPKKPIGDLHSVPHYRCPNCNSTVKLFFDSPVFDYCEYCGQCLDWSEA